MTHENESDLVTIRPATPEKPGERLPWCHGNEGPSEVCTCADRLDYRFDDDGGAK